MKRPTPFISLKLSQSLGFLVTWLKLHNSLSLLGIQCCNGTSNTWSKRLGKSKRESTLYHILSRKRAIQELLRTTTNLVFVTSFKSPENQTNLRPMTILYLPLPFIRSFLLTDLKRIGTSGRNPNPRHTVGEGGK